MEYIYFSTADGGMVDNYDIVRMAKVVSNVDIDAKDFKSIRMFAQCCKGIIKEINPSIKHLVKNGNKVKAVMLHHRRHPEISLRDCKEIMDKIEMRFKR